MRSLSVFTYSLIKLNEVSTREYCNEEQYRTPTYKKGFGQPSKGGLC